MRRHLWASGAFGRICAASKVKSFVKRARITQTPRCVGVQINLLQMHKFIWTPTQRRLQHTLARDTNHRNFELHRKLAPATVYRNLQTLEEKLRVTHTQ